MFVSLRTIQPPEDGNTQHPDYLEELRTHAAALPGVRDCHLVPSLDGVSINAGRIIWRMTFASERDAHTAMVHPVWLERIRPLLRDCLVNGVGYRNTRSEARGSGSGIWRALVFRVMPRGSPDLVRQLEEDTLSMPGHVGTIRSWALNTVSFSEGAKPFTHVWEQEFDNVEGLTGEYMTHPVHWGIVDRYFDAECPEYVVDPYLMQLVCGIDRSIMG